MSKTAKRPNKLIAYIMHFKRCDQQDAEVWADKHCGDWRNTPLPRVRRVKSISSDDKEWEE